MADRGLALQLTFPSGQPHGLRVLEAANWSGQGVAFPREALPEAAQREEMSRVGVYTLWRPHSHPAGTKLYVGQSENVLSRIVQHERENSSWTDAAAFTSKDAFFSSRHAQYLEASLISRASELKRSKLQNKRIPNIPELSKADTRAADRFLANLLICLPLLRLEAFEPVSRISQPEPSFSIDHRSSKHHRLAGVYATGEATGTGFTINAGALVAAEEGAAFQRRNILAKRKRDRMKQDGKLVPSVDNPQLLVLTEDLYCGSPSQAAELVLGRIDGRNNWKDVQGRSFGEVEVSRE